MKGLSFYDFSHKKTSVTNTDVFLCFLTWQRPTLPQSCPCSTIGALKLNLRVRYGNGCYLQAIITRCLFVKIYDFGINRYSSALAEEFH